MLLVAFSCAAPSAVPKTMSAGCGHEISGVPFSTDSETLDVADV